MSRKDSSKNLICAAKQLSFCVLCFATLLFAAGVFKASAQNPILVEQNEYFGYRDRKGAIIIPVQYSLAGEFSGEGIASVLDRQG